MSILNDFRTKREDKAWRKRSFLKYYANIARRANIINLHFLFSAIVQSFDTLFFQLEHIMILNTKIFHTHLSSINSEQYLFSPRHSCFCHISVIHDKIHRVQWTWGDILNWHPVKERLFDAIHGILVFYYIIYLWVNNIFNYTFNQWW